MLAYLDLKKEKTKICLDKILITNSEIFLFFLKKKAIDITFSVLQNQFYIILYSFSLTQNCSILTDLDDLPDDKFITYLTDPCRYDKNVRPNLTTPFEVKVKMELTHLEATQTVSYNFHLDKSVILF